MHILRIDPGEDVAVSVKQFLADSKLRQAVIVGGYGTLTEHHLRWVMHNKLPVENTYARGEGGIEILSMNGLVVEGEPHIHMTLSTPEGAYGGHLLEGCVSYLLCEIMFAEVEGATLTREDVEVDVPGIGKGTVPRLVFKPAASS